MPQDHIKMRTVLWTDGDWSWRFPSFPSDCIPERSENMAHVFSKTFSHHMVLLSPCCSLRPHWGRFPRFTNIWPLLHPISWTYEVLHWAVDGEVASPVRTPWHMGRTGLRSSCPYWHLFTHTAHNYWGPTNYSTAVLEGAIWQGWDKIKDLTLLSPYKASLPYWFTAAGGKVLLAPLCVRLPLSLLLTRHRSSGVRVRLTEGQVTMRTGALSLGCAKC